MTAPMRRLFAIIEEKTEDLVKTRIPLVEHHLKL
jgi:hypothetical protein